uniref:Uncharacterized protein n=1 Tax=Knipowitschia caucasica TaxID=637954 RepID=A0AAV2LQL7_KNICA
MDDGRLDQEKRLIQALLLKWRQAEREHAQSEQLWQEKLETCLTAEDLGGDHPWRKSEEAWFLKEKSFHIHVKGLLRSMERKLEEDSDECPDLYELQEQFCPVAHGDISRLPSPSARIATRSTLEVESTQVKDTARLGTPSFRVPNVLLSRTDTLLPEESCALEYSEERAGGPALKSSSENKEEEKEEPEHITHNLFNIDISALPAPAVATPPSAPINRNTAHSAQDKTRDEQDCFGPKLPPPSSTLSRSTGLRPRSR